MEVRLDKIKSKIKKLLNNKDCLTKHFLKTDCRGYIYCITNVIINIYNEDIYKLGSTSDLKNRLRLYNQLYFDEIIIKKIVEVPYKCMFEALLFIKLKNNRIRKGREFFREYKDIKKELERIEEIISKNDEISSIEKYYEEIIGKEEIYKFSNEEIKRLTSINNSIIYLCKKVEYKIETIDYGDKIKKKIINYKCENDKNGILLNLEIPEIKYNFEGDIKVILIREKIDLSLTEFVGKVKMIDCIRINNKKLTKLLLYDMLNNSHIKNRYFLCNSERINEIFKKLRYYNENYRSIEKIKKKYLFDNYNEGEDVEADVIDKDELFKEINILSRYEKFKLNEDIEESDSEEDDNIEISEDTINVEEIFKRMNILSRYEKYILNEDT
jgi:hypothetical protein